MVKTNTYVCLYVSMFAQCANKELFLPQVFKKPGGNEFAFEKCKYGNASFRDTKVIISLVGGKSQNICSRALCSV